MRLLNTQTLQLEEFFSSIPPYAILSHCWGIDEVTFEEVYSLPESKNVIKHKAGWRKVVACCQQTLQEGFQYVWIDTCCINKSSSAELSEAINSMFRWYRDAAVCFAYLADVPNLANEASFFRSRWFTRGWTLQELIAPREVIFLDASWHSATTRRLIANKIQQATDIDAAVLLDSRPLRSYSVAQRFSWAARRNTTRLEDQAYSLLGLFGVHMPLLYGEGSNAFLRLQEEVLRVEQDLSIFAWSIPVHIDLVEIEGGILPLAPSLSFFTHCSGIVPAMSAEQRLFEIPDVVVTAHSVRLTTKVVKVPSNVPGSPERLAAVLHCRHDRDITKIIAMELHPVFQFPVVAPTPDSEPLRVRMNNRIFFLRDRLVLVDVLDLARSGVSRTILIQRVSPWFETAGPGKENRCSRLWVRFEDSSLDRIWTTKAVFPEQHWTPDNRTFDLIAAFADRKEKLQSPFTYDHWIQSIQAAIVMSDGAHNQIVLYFRVQYTSPFRTTIAVRLDHYHASSYSPLTQKFGNTADDASSSIQLCDGNSLTVQRRGDIFTDICIAHLAISLSS